MTSPVIENGPFKIYEENVYHNSHLILYRTDPTKAIISISQRNKLKAESQFIFDDMIFTIRNQGNKVEYTNSFDNMFDIEKAVNQFSDEKLIEENKIFNNQYNIDLTEEEIYAAASLTKAKERYEELAKNIREKVSKKLGQPHLPYEMSTNLDLNLFYGANALKAEKWINDPTYSDDDLHCPDMRKANLLRLNAKGRIETLSGNSLALAVAKQVVERAYDKWANNGVNYYTVPNLKIRRGSDNWGRQTHSLEIYDTNINIGCQQVPKAEVERIGRQMGWI